VRGEVVLTVTLLQLFFLGQHLSGRLEYSNVIHLFLFEVFLPKM
jgi:hypothetical protein